MLLHKRNTPYSCPEFDYKCNDNENLNRHMNVHKGIRKYKPSRGQNDSLPLHNGNVGGSWGHSNDVTRLIEALKASDNNGFPLSFKNSKQMRPKDLVK